MMPSDDAEKRKQSGGYRSAMNRIKRQSQQNGARAWRHVMSQLNYKYNDVIIAEQGVRDCIHTPRHLRTSALCRVQYNQLERALRAYAHEYYNAKELWKIIRSEHIDIGNQPGLPAVSEYQAVYDNAMRTLQLIRDLPTV